MAEIIWDEKGTPKCSCGSSKLDVIFERKNNDISIFLMRCLGCGLMLDITPEFETWVKNQEWKVSHERV